MSLRDLIEKARMLVEPRPKPFVVNLRRLAVENTDFRRVVYTGKRIQFTVMDIPPKGEVGAETHETVEQVFFCVSGSGEASYNGTKVKFDKGDVLAVPPGTNHNIVNTGSESLKFYTSYSPPNHLPDTVHKTKADADADADDEKFGQKVAKERA